MMPEIPVRIAIFGHADDLRQENNNKLVEKKKEI